MKKHGQMIGSEILALALLLSLAGCLPGEEGPDAGNTQTGAAQSEPGTVEPAGYIPPEENRSFAASGMDCCPTEDGTGFYCPGTQILRYYDPAARDLITLCSQSGCAHGDESCEAWLGESVSGFAAYEGSWYVLAEENNSAVLRRIDPQTRERADVKVFQSQNIYDSYRLSSGVVAHGYVYAWLDHDWWEDQTVYQKESFLIRISQDNGTTDTLFDTADYISPADRVTFAGADEEQVLILAETLTSDYLTQEEYLAQNPGEDYGLYLMDLMEEEGVYELREYAFDMSDYRVVAEGARTSSSWALTRYGDLTLYAVDNTLYVYDLATGESRMLVEAPGTLRNFLMVDGKVMYLVRDPELHVCYLDLDDGEIHTLENEGKTDGAVFSIMGECGSTLFGNYNGKEGNLLGCYISKEDYYAERYENIFY